MSYKSAQKEISGAIQVNCAVCDSNSYNPLFYIPPKRIVECSNCGHEYVNPIPDPKNVPEYMFYPEKEESIETQISIAYLRKIFDRYGIREGKLLDVGCGNGRLEKKLIELGYAPQGLYLMDVSEKNLEAARNKYPLSAFIHGDAQEGIGIDNYFDCVLMVEFLEHLSHPAKALQNALDTLKIGGLLIMMGLPNNMSLEAFIGQDRWRMRQFVHHFHFFNHTTFSTFAQNFSKANILEFGTFLQEGYRFYDIARIARNTGVVKESRGDEHITYGGDVVKTSDLTGLVLAKIMSVDFGGYKHGDRLPAQQIDSSSSAKDMEEFFNLISLDQFLSPDFSVVMRKEGG